MKKISFILALLIMGTNADAATRATGAVRINPNDAVDAAMAGEQATTETTQSARSARRAPSNRTSPAAQSSLQQKQNTPAPAATPTRGVANRGNNTTSNQTAGRSALPAVSARAAKQNVISTGTKVTSAAQNTAIDEECWNGFMGCMDSFCMLDNANGGRCICSDKNAEYDTILEEIQKLDEQSYQLATVGVEQIEMGNAADAVMARTKDVTKSVEKDTKDAQSKRKSLDLSQWNSTGTIDFDADVEDIFSLSSDGISIDNKTGDALFRASAKLCHAQMPNCANQSTMMELMYKQRVRSDCTAYENSLRQQRTQSAQKLYAAQSAMREAALEQYQNANKYDLGQCTVQFKQCMQTTGGCGEDFTGCVDLAARAEASRSASETGKAAKQKTISGLSSKITIAASTYDTLLAKQPLCMTVTEQCVNVRDQVWDTFIREVAPQVKAAELVVESNMRSSCISNISNCFQKACRDTMDPNDPEGSYDMCLTRPQTLESLCRVEIEPCKAAEPKIMDYVVARLASMRVDSCTREFKECLQSEDRCGADYTQCVGLDTDTIVKLCPAEKLVGCQYDYDDGYGSATYGDGSDTGGKKGRVRTNREIYAELAQIAQGIFLNIDNNMLTACQKAANAAMIKVCGSTEDCNDLVIDDGTGSRSFKYQVCEYNGSERTPGSLSGTSQQKKPKWTGLCYDSLDAIPLDKLQHQESGSGWASKLSGIIYWGNIGYSVDESIGDNLPQTKITFTTEDEYINKLTDLGMAPDTEEREIIHNLVFATEISALTSTVENAIKAIESDPTVQYCMYGRRFQGMRDANGNIDYKGTVLPDGTVDKASARFPQLTAQMRQVIAASALVTARDNYMEKYDEEIKRMMNDQVKAAQKIDREHAKDIAVKTCIDWAQSSAVPASATPEYDSTGTWVGSILLVAAAVAITVLTDGLGAPLLVAALAGAGTAISDTDMYANATPGVSNQGSTEYVGNSKTESWNQKIVTTTTPNRETGECTKVTVTYNCDEEKNNVCVEWKEPVKTVTTVKLWEE